MALKLSELISILFSALVMGVFWGPWLALTRSISTFRPEVFLDIVHRMSRNIGPVMTGLMPVALLTMVPVLFFSYSGHPLTFYFTLTALVLFLIALLVTMLIEVPIVTQMMAWTAATLPDNWQQLRDRWASFHIIRIVAAIAGLALLVAGALF
jgi:uncharacterized membrane protein